eukprot:3957709-Pleurochrysis_carterae.AAC.1
MENGGDIEQEPSMALQVDARVELRRHEQAADPVQRCQPAAQQRKLSKAEPKTTMHATAINIADTYTNGSSMSSSMLGTMDSGSDAELLAQAAAAGKH